MFSFFRKTHRLALLALCAMTLSLEAWEDCDFCDSCPSNRLYIGAFGGGIYSNSPKISQMGTAFFSEAEGGPLAVFAQGHSRKNSTGFGGAQIGYEWSQYNACSNWGIAPAIELETYFFNNKARGHLINPTTRLDEHDFVNSFDMDMGVLLANAVLSLDTPCLREFSPYVGGGIGAIHLSIRNADSLQVAPEEFGINHFNSKRSDSSWAFAAQIKAGVRYNISKSFHIFGEYRYLFVDASNYILGSTVYPNHAPTSPWNIKVNPIQYNAFAIGIQYDL